MIKDVASVQLRAGQTMQIRMIEPPEEDYGLRLIRFLEHKRDDSRRALQQRLRGMYAEHCLDRYFVGEVEGQIAGQAWYGLPRLSAAQDREIGGIGNFGHVFTDPQWRGQGIASELVRVLVDDFLAEPSGACLLCSASTQSGRIYRKFGFEFIPPTATSGAMGLVKPQAAASFAELEQRYFAPGRPVQVREGNIGDRHDVDRLLDFSPAWLEARRHWHFAGLTHTVPTYIAALHKVEDGCGLLTVLQTDRGSVVGYAFALNLGSPHESHLLTCDFALHPHYLSQARTLLEETLRLAQQDGSATLCSFVAACDERKLQALLEVGFTIQHRFPGAFDLEGEAHDLLLLTR